MANQESQLCFAGWVLDTRDGGLRGPKGEVAQLRPKAQQVLVVLLSQADTVVSRDALATAVWPDVVVTDDSLAQCIREIRSALGEQGHTLIRTLPKRGYKLDLPSPEHVASPMASAGSARWAGSWRLIIAVAALLLAVLIYAMQPGKTPVHPPTILVDAFAAIGSGEREARLARGMTADIVALLGQHAWLQIRQASVGEVLAEDVDYRLSGTLSRDEDTLRVSLSLTDTRSHQVSWSQLWQGPAIDLFEIQSQLLDAVEAAITPGWSGVIAKDRMRALAGTTAHLPAFDLYLRAIDHKHHFTPDALTAAEVDLRAAIRLDPDYGRAWVALAIVHLLQMQQANTQTTFQSHLDQRIIATRRAMQLMPSDAEVLIQSTFYHARAGQFDKAEAALREAVAQSWNNADILATAAWGGARRVPVGSDALSWAERALQLNPTPPKWYYAGLGTAAFYAGDYARAVEAFSAAPPNTEVLYRWAAAEMALGNVDRATDLLQSAEFRLPSGLTIAELEEADGNSYPAYVEQLQSLLDAIRGGAGVGG